MTPDNSNPKKKHNWMAGFFVAKPATDADKVASEQAYRARAIWDGNNGHRLPKR